MFVDQKAKCKHGETKKLKCLLSSSKEECSTCDHLTLVLAHDIKIYTLIYTYLMLNPIMVNC